MYALAKLYTIEQVEEFAQQLINHFLTDNPQVRKVQVQIAEYQWTRINFGGKPHPHSFVLDSNGKPSVEVTATRQGSSLTSGIDGFTFMKSTQSG